MSTAIPASKIVGVNPDVLSAGGDSLALNGLVLSTNSRIPFPGVVSLGSANAVKSYFGESSVEYSLAKTYFGGFEGSTIKPSMLHFAPFAQDARAAFLRSATLPSLTSLQTITTGALTITVDGVAHTSGTIDLSGATSYANAAALIQTALASAVTVAFDSIKTAFVLTSPTTGAASTITYASGASAATLGLTQSAGAIISQGCAADTEDSALSNAVASTQNWSGFMTTWEPDDDSKILFAQWVNAQDERYFYVAFDTSQAMLAGSAPTSFGAVVKDAAYSTVLALCGNSTVATNAGTTLLVSLRDKAAFVLGACASIDFARVNGRITFDKRRQDGLLADVLSEPEYDNLIANGYSAYCKFSTANDEFSFVTDAAVGSKWLWLDSFVNQVYLNSELQLALMSLLTSINSAPYNDAGYNLIRAAMMDPIMAAVNFGSIRTGVSLSNSQIAQLTSAAGLDISGSLQNDGYYLQILDPGASVRANRGTPIINLWYTDGGAVQKISLASINVQ